MSIVVPPRKSGEDEPPKSTDLSVGAAAADNELADTMMRSARQTQPSGKLRRHRSSSRAEISWPLPGPTSD